MTQIRLIRVYREGTDWIADDGVTVREYPTRAQAEYAAQVRAWGETWPRLKQEK